jgi:hypothetical protein
MTRADIRQRIEREQAQLRYLESRVRRLPGMLDAARHKVAALENEARRYGMNDLVEAVAGVTQ